MTCEQSKFDPTILNKNSKIRFTNKYLDEIDRSGIKNIIAKYDLKSLFQALDNPNTPQFVSEVLVTIAANDKCCFGKDKNIDNETIKSIVDSTSEILRRTTPIIDIAPFRYVRQVRPIWYTFPEYYKLLEPFKKDVKNILRLDLDDIANKIKDSENSNFHNSDYGPMDNLLSDLTIHYSKCKILADLWYYLIVDFDEFKLELTNKLSEVLYVKLCSKLQMSNKNFGARKGKSLEKYVRSDFYDFMPYCTTINNFDLNGKEKDLLIFGDRFGLAIESKSCKIRNDSSDWSSCGIKDDIGDIKDGIRQVEDTLCLLKNGGSITDNLGISREIKPKEINFGFVITDQIYTSYIRGTIDVEIDENGHIIKDENWHGKNIWIGSFIDLHFLLNISQTPSILLDYLLFMRSKPTNRFIEEPEAWTVYCCNDSLLPAIGRKDIDLIVNNGIRWDLAKKEGFNHFLPSWLHRYREVIDLDNKGKIIDSLEIVRQCRREAIKRKIRGWDKYLAIDAENCSDNVNKMCKLSVDNRKMKRCNYCFSNSELIAI